MGSGYCTFTLIDVVSFLGFGFMGGAQGAGAQFGPTQAGGADAGITVGCGAGIPPVKLSAHTMPAAATTTRMTPRIPSFLTIPSSSFRKLTISYVTRICFNSACAATYFFTFAGMGGGGAMGTGPHTGPQTGFGLM